MGVGTHMLELPPTACCDEAGLETGGGTEITAHPKLHPKTIALKGDIQHEIRRS